MKKSWWTVTLSLKPALSSFPHTLSGLGGFWKDLGCEGHPENILLLPLFKDHWIQRGPFLQHFVFRLQLPEQIIHGRQLAGMQGCVPSSAINCRSKSATQIAKKRTVPLPGPGLAQSVSCPPAHHLSELLSWSIPFSFLCGSGVCWKPLSHYQWTEIPYFLSTGSQLHPIEAVVSELFGSV